MRRAPLSSPPKPREQRFSRRLVGRTRLARVLPLLPRPPFRRLDEKLSFLKLLHGLLLFTLPLDFLLATERVEPPNEGLLHALLVFAGLAALLGLLRSRFVAAALGLTSIEGCLRTSRWAAPTLTLLVVTGILLEALRLPKSFDPRALLSLGLLIAMTVIPSLVALRKKLRELQSSLHDERVRLQRVQDSILWFTALTLVASRLVSVFGALAVAPFDAGPLAALPSVAAGFLLLQLFEPRASIFLHPCKQCRNRDLVVSEEAPYCPSCGRGKNPRPRFPTKTRSKAPPLWRRLAGGE